MKDLTVRNLSQQIDCFYDFHTSLAKPLAGFLEAIDHQVDSQVVEVRRVLNSSIHETHDDWNE
jgi:hypothetical protein